MYFFKMVVFWGLSPCSLVEVNRRFRCAYCLHDQGDEVSTNFYKITRRSIPEGRLDILCRDNLKSRHVYLSFMFVAGPYYPLGNIGTVPRAYDIFKTYEEMEERRNKN
jgi:hypothetical protein